MNEEATLIMSILPFCAKVQNTNVAVEQTVMTFYLSEALALAYYLGTHSHQV